MKQLISQTKQSKIKPKQLQDTTAQPYGKQPKNQTSNQQTTAKHISNIVAQTTRH